MRSAPSELSPARILVVDDERQIHASIRLRIGRDYALVCCADAREALEKIHHEQFDLCFADIHMPHLNGFAFIEKAREADSGLGFVILSAFDDSENLRRAIPLEIYEFLGKPLPEREGFERRIPEWIERTRRRRRELHSTSAATHAASDLAAAQLAHEVELVASESAREALLQTANLLTTIHAHLVAASTLLAPKARQDPGLTHLFRNLEAARNTAEASVTVAEGFFHTAYGQRESSPAWIDSGIQQAIDIARRCTRADELNKTVDHQPWGEPDAARGLSGIEFLLMIVPVISLALVCASNGATIRIECSSLSRIDEVLKSGRVSLWVNRRNSLIAQRGLQLLVTSSAPALDRHEIDTWLAGAPGKLSSVAARGLVAGLQKSGALLGVASPPAQREFALVLALPI